MKRCLIILGAFAVPALAFVLIWMGMLSVLIEKAHGQTHRFPHIDIVNTLPSGACTPANTLEQYSGDLYTCDPGTLTWRKLSGTAGPPGPAGPTGPAGTINNFIGSATGGALTATINGAINPMAAPYNAKGDCVTDDHNAIMAAQDAAIALAVNNSLPAALAFPKPPGGCFLTSTIQWKGVSLIGQPSGLGSSGVHSYGVTIKGMPGEDILAPPDPAVSSGYTWYTSPLIQDIAFLVDASVPVGTAPNIHPHRWPGRWFDDAVVLGPVTATFTNGSAVIAGVNSYTAGQVIQFTTTGSLPTNFATSTDYYVSATGLSGTQFEVTPVGGGAAIVAGSAGSGTQTAVSFTITSPLASIGCSDIGQAVVVDGAGATVTTTTLAAAITSTTAKTLTITGTTSSSWPVISGYLKIDSEIVMYVGTQANGISTITVMRGQAGTTAATHSSGATVTVMGNLTTTIASMDPCWAISANSVEWKVVKLAAPAQTSISSGHAYISILDLPVTTNIGNCAIALDNFDALSTDWPNPGGVTTGTLNARFLRVNFETNQAGALNAANQCGYFQQGAWINYGMGVHDSLIAAHFGVVLGNAEINSWWTAYGDFQDWTHLNFTNNFFPWISYNGGEGHMSNVEVTAFAGPQFMSLGNAFADTGSWDVNVTEIESWSPPDDTRFGLRISGGIGYVLRNTETSMSAEPINKAWIDTTALTCYGCFADAGGTNLYGAGNTIQKATGSTTVTDLGRNNITTNWFSATWASGVPNPTTQNFLPQKGVPNLNGGQEPDFAADGFPATPYRHEDMFIWPKDFVVFNSNGILPWTGYWYTSDPNSISGGELFIHTGATFNSFFTASTSNVVSPTNYTIGTNFPAAPGTIYFSLLCPTATSSNIAIASSDGGTFSQNISCTTSLATYALPFDYTGHTGNIAIGNLSSTPGQDYKLAWAYIAFAPKMPAGSSVGGFKIPGTSTTPPTAGAGVCWKTATTLGTCTAGTWPNCSTCN